MQSSILPRWSLIACAAASLALPPVMAAELGDMAVLSLPLMVLAPFGLYLAEVGTKSLWVAAGLFFAQYVLTAISARNAGERFVCNVLAVHSAKKVSSAKAPAAAKATSSGSSAAA